MDRLSNDDLLHIFGFVDLAALVGPVRAVCHRWRDLALERCVWKNRTFSSEAADCTPALVRPALAARVLQLAPCLAVLEAGDCRYKESPAYLSELLLGTACAVTELGLLLDHEADESIAQCLNSQVAKGRLRALSLDVYSSFFETLVHDKILRILGGLHLDELTYQHFGEDFRLHLTCKEAWRAGSLKRLSYSGRCSDASLAFLLEVRAASLLELRICTNVKPDSSVPSLQVLSKCTSLVKVDMPALEEVIHLQNCTGLTSLALNECLSSGAFAWPTKLVDAVYDLLVGPSAASLTQLKFYKVGPSETGVAIQILPMMFFPMVSCCSSLEELSLDLFPTMPRGERLGPYLLPGTNESLVDAMRDLEVHRLCNA